MSSVRLFKIKAIAAKKAAKVKKESSVSEVESAHLQFVNLKKESLAELQKTHAMISEKIKKMNNDKFAMLSSEKKCEIASVHLEFLNKIFLDIQKKQLEIKKLEIRDVIVVSPP